MFLCALRFIYIGGKAIFFFDLCRCSILDSQWTHQKRCRFRFRSNINEPITSRWIRYYWQHNVNGYNVKEVTAYLSVAPSSDRWREASCARWRPEIRTRSSSGSCRLVPHILHGRTCCSQLGRFRSSVHVRRKNLWTTPNYSNKIAIFSPLMIYWYWVRPIQRPETNTDKMCAVSNGDKHWRRSQCSVNTSA